VQTSELLSAGVKNKQDMTKTRDWNINNDDSNRNSKG